MQPLNSLDRYLTFFLARNPWTNVYGFSRSLLALGTLLTLVFNDMGTLIRPAAGQDPFEKATGINQYSLFNIIEYPEISRWICISILILVLIGYYPRLTALLHVYINFSFMSSVILSDGGDQVTLVMSVLLLPLALTDPRTWHWSNVIHTTNKNEWYEIRKLIGLSSYPILRIQVAVIYFEACVAKFNVTEWANGTALYYWFSDPIFGLSPNVLQFFLPILTNHWCIVILTWSVLFIEGTLFLCLTIESRYRRYFLILGICFHFMIVLVHGLPTFFLAMTASLIIYLRPFYNAFEFKALNLDLVRLKKFRLKLS